MKKITVLLSLAFLVFSCSDDDESSAEDLIGTWLWTQSFENGEEDDLDDCQKTSTITFEENEYSQSYFEIINDECVEEGSISGASYEATSNTITFIDTYTDLDEDGNEIEVEEEIVSSYVIDGSTLTVTSEDSYDEDDDGVEEEYIYRDVYTKQ